MLHELAEVSFHGATPTFSQTQLEAETIGERFEFDGAADYYAYASLPEDVAMLFEAYMMYQQYQAVVDVAFLAEPNIADPYCNDYKIGWGQRDRLADSNVKARAQRVAERILMRDLSVEFSYIAATPEPLTLWCRLV